MIDDCVRRQDVIQTIYNNEDRQDICEAVRRLEPASPVEQIGHCKDCKHFERDVFMNELPLIIAHNICNKWGRGCGTREDGYCYLFESRGDEE